MNDRLTVAEVLSRFDREVGLEETVRATGGSSATAAAVDAASGPVVRGAPARASVAPASSAEPSPQRIHAPAPAPARPVPEVRPIPAASLRAPGSPGERAARLAEIEARHAETCPHCTTATGHTRLVFGEGAPDADILFVGESPGEAEDRAGRPFVGPAGEKLEEMIRAMGLRREDVYIANVLKSRPPEDRSPMPDEVAGCGPFLVEQILAVQPRVIVTLGGPATKFVCATETGITRIRGTWQRWLPPAGAECPEIAVMPTYHPAYVLHTYTMQVRGEVWSDLRGVLAKLGRTPPVRAEGQGG